MAPPGPNGLGFFGVGALGVGAAGVGYDVYSGERGYAISQEHNKWLRDFNERQMQAQAAANIWNQSFSERNLAMQGMQFRKNFDWERYIAQHGMRMRVEDLKRAGINPVVASGIAPVSSPPVHTSPVSGTSGVSGGSSGGFAGYSPSRISGSILNSVVQSAMLDLRARKLQNLAGAVDLKRDTMEFMAMKRYYDRLLRMGRYSRR